MQMDQQGGTDELDAETHSFGFQAPSSAVDDAVVDEEFDSHSPTKISAAAATQELTQDEHVDLVGSDGVDDADSEDDNFEFGFVMNGPESFLPMIADDIFSEGRLLPVYPVFDRSLLAQVVEQGEEVEEEKDESTAAVRKQLRALFIEERDQETNSTGTAAASEASPKAEEVDELQGIPEDTYCIWTPRAASASSSSSGTSSPAWSRKSGSTGSLVRWRLRDLVVGRSHSDGKEKFVFLAAEDKKPVLEEKETAENEKTAPGFEVAAQKMTAAAKKGKKKPQGSGRKVAEMDMATAHRIFYGQSSASGAGRRSYLPYRQDIIGFFTSVNGLSRSYHPS